MNRISRATLALEPPKCHDWDGEHIHLGLRCEQSAATATTACGLELSTWPGPNSPADWSTNWESYLGYAWDPDKVTCPRCRDTLKGELELA